jgi:O-glycosyl hydrolase
MSRSTTAKALSIIIFAVSGAGCSPPGSRPGSNTSPSTLDAATAPLDTGGSSLTAGALATGGTGDVSSPGGAGGSPGGASATAEATGGLPSSAGTTAIAGAAGTAGGAATAAGGSTTGGSKTGGATGAAGAAGSVATGGATGGSKTGGVAGGAGATTGGNMTTGGAASSGGTSSSGTRAPNTGANVNYSKAKQVIDGFGISNAWLYPPASKTGVYDALFSISKGAGLSILRNRVPFRENPTNDDKFINKNTDGTYKYTANSDGSKTFSLNWTNWDVGNTSTLISDIKAAGSDYQVTKFLSTPWTPPNNSVSKWKVSDSYKTMNYNTPEVGGTLDSAHYADYADVLADYVLGYKAKMGVDLTVLSLQNEPNFQCTYESANWTAAQFDTFFGTLKTEFTKKGVFTQLPNLKIMAPEFANVKEDLILPTLSDTNVSSLLGVVGVHQYEFGKSNVNTYSPPTLTNSLAAGKRIWMTEFSTAAWTADTSMTDGLIVARLVHMDLVVGQMSAFLYWWAWGSGNGCLAQSNGNQPKRLYAVGQYSRFVRPDWIRVDAVASPATNVYMSAFKNPAGNQVAVVAINTGTSIVPLALTIDAGRFGALTTYRTSASENLANVGALTGGTTVSVSLAPSSVTTFVGSVGP